MPSIGPLSPSVAFELARSSSDDWTSLDNILVEDGTTATSNAGNTSPATYVLGARSFGGSIPASAQIDGIVLEVKARSEYPQSHNFGGAIEQAYLFTGSTIIAGNTNDLLLDDTLEWFTYGSPTDTWVLSGTYLNPTFLNSSDFGVGVYMTMSTGFDRIDVDHIRVTFYYTILNNAPTISSVPSVSYGSFSRLGPSNTPATVTFTATDVDGDALTYEIRTAAGGGGTLVGSGSCTSGVSKQHAIASTASGLVNGSNTLYLRIFDGIAYSSDSSFVILRDTTSPSATDISVFPETVG